MRLPVAAKIALATAGAIGGSPGSPTPVGGSLLSTMYTSTCGMCFEVLSNPERARKLTDLFQQIEADALQEALQKRKAHSSDADDLEVTQ